MNINATGLMLGFNQEQQVALAARLSQDLIPARLNQDHIPIRLQPSTANLLFKLGFNQEHPVSYHSQVSFKCSQVRHPSRIQPRSIRFINQPQTPIMQEAMHLTGEKLTKSQVKTLKDTFKALDQNHDGRISETELKRACKKLGILLTKEEVTDIISEADVDGNGYIEYKEFEKLVGHQLVIANYKNKQLRKAFRRFDKDGDGFITAIEIKQVFQETGVELDDEEIAELVAEADENGDGVISFEEFVSTVCEKDW